MPRTLCRVLRRGHISFKVPIYHRIWNHVFLCFFISSCFLLENQACGQQVPSAVDETVIGDQDEELDDILNLADESLESLSTKSVVVPAMDLEVSTVSRTKSTVGRSPAAVYVLTNEMIRRSAARSIPEVLRLVPGVQVARITSNAWAISIRGFNQQYANKLLVQIDGRSVYTPLYAGVFWDIQDVLLEDVERIEIIRGPGATIWGANAVNGVINIITKRADDTQGLFVEGGGGNERGFASARIGSQSKDIAWRLHGKWFDRDSGFSPTRGSHGDWHVGRLGFRTDWEPNCQDTVTFQGDYFDGSAQQFEARPIPTFPFSQNIIQKRRRVGGNALFRWTHQIEDDSDIAVQFYYDRTEWDFDVSGLGEERDTVDLDVQHRFHWRDRHSVVWGLGYRNSRDRIRNSPFEAQFQPTERTLDRFSIFAQDEMTLVDDLLFLTTGSKFSWNDFTGFEIQPTVRLLYTPSNRQSVWASVSRAVRVPSRGTDDVRVIVLPVNGPVFPTLVGNRSMVSEQLLAWELGMRSAPSDEFYWDLALFYNQYKDKETQTPGLPGFDPISGVFALPLNLGNGEDVETYGVELASTWKIDSRWTLRGAYSLFQIDEWDESPRNQFFAHSSWDLGSDWEFDLVGRFVGKLEESRTPGYFELDTRLAWRPTDSFELALVGRNLLDESHPEFPTNQYTGPFATEMQREVYGMVTWRY